MAELTEMQMNVHLGSRAWAEVMLDTGRRTQGVGASATELELAGVGGGGTDAVLGGLASIISVEER